MRLQARPRSRRGCIPTYEDTWQRPLFNRSKITECPSVNTYVKVTFSLAYSGCFYPIADWPRLSFLAQGPAEMPSSHCPLSHGSCPLLWPNQTALGQGRRGGGTDNGFPLLLVPGCLCPWLVLNSSHHSAHCPFLQLPVVKPSGSAPVSASTLSHSELFFLAGKCPSGL